MTSMTGVLRKRNMGNEFRQRGGYVKIQGEHYVHEDSYLLPGREALHTSFPHCPQKEPALLTCGSWTLSLQDNEAIHFCISQPV